MTTTHMTNSIRLLLDEAAALDHTCLYDIKDWAEDAEILAKDLAEKLKIAIAVINALEAGDEDSAHDFKTRL